MITGTYWKFVRFLTPEMASKKVGTKWYWILDAMFGIVFDPMSGVENLNSCIPTIPYTTSAFNPS